MSTRWESKALGDLCEILDSQRKPITKRNRTNGEYPYYGATGIVDHVSEFIFDEPLVLVGEDGAKWASGENTAFHVEGKCWVNNHAHVLRPRRTTVNDNWLVYYLNHSDLTEFVSGLTVPKLNQGNLREIPVPIPSLSEQQRIVGVLDEAFAGLATAKANAEKNLQNARALFESHLQSVFTRSGEKWVARPLVELCEVFSDGDWIESKDQSSSGIRLVQTGNVGIGVFKDRAEKARFISQSTFKRLRCTEIVAGDCLISRLPDPVGRSCILPGTGDRMITAVDCTIVRFKSKVCLPEFFNLYSQSTKYLSAVAEKCTGTTRSRISRTSLGLTPIPVPPLEEQRRIAAHLDVLAADTQRLDQLYRQKLVALDALSKSLLHQAFSGSL